MLLSMMLAGLEMPGAERELVTTSPLMEKLIVELVRSRPRQYCFHEGRMR
jgi:hypothetical protein